MTTPPREGAYHRRAVLAGLAAVAAGAGGGGIYAADPYLEPAQWWYDVIGVDVSHHQGRIDWPTLARTDVAFAYIKATEGGDFRDRRFQENWSGARDAGLKRGAYHFYTLCRPGAVQARNFMAAVPRERGALPPVVDLEHLGPCRSGPRVADVADQVATFLNMLQDHYGRRPVLYITVGFDWMYLRGRFAEETFWIRSLVVPPWFRTDRWLIWQYHNRGRRAGVTGPVDLNAFRGSRRDLDAFAGGGASA